MDLHSRFEGRVKVAQDTGCWEWLLYIDKRGYGQMTHQGKPMGCHRASYELHIGPIPSDMTVDHICFNTICLNPSHLQLLTHSANAQRQRSSLLTHCASGHPFNEENTYIKSGFRAGRRGCRKCNLAAVRRYKQRLAAGSGKA